MSSSPTLATLPAAERFEHGARARYISGCRCDACRRANTEYEKARARARATGEWNGLVSATSAREHLARLSVAGVGYKTAADAAKVAPSIVARIVQGTKTRIRAATERRLLEVDAGAAADHAIIDGRATWTDIRWLLARGLTRGEIALRIGNEHPALQLRRRRVLASTANRIARLRREVEAELAASAGVVAICPDCGYSHAPADRQRIVSRMAGADPVHIVEAWPCFYDDGKGPGGGGYKMLMRDLAIVRAGRRA